MATNDNVISTEIVNFIFDKNLWAVLAKLTMSTTVVIGTVKSIKYRLENYEELRQHSIFTCLNQYTHISIPNSDIPDEKVRAVVEFMLHIKINSWIKFCNKIIDGKGIVDHNGRKCDFISEQTTCGSYTLDHIKAFNIKVVINGIPAEYMKHMSDSFYYSLIKRTTEAIEIIFKSKKKYNRCEKLHRIFCTYRQAICNLWDIAIGTAMFLPPEVLELIHKVDIKKLKKRELELIG